MEKISEFFLFLMNISAILREFPHWFHFLLIFWIVIGLCVLLWFLKRLLSIKKLPKGFSFLKTIFSIFKISPRWLQLTLMVWVVTAFFLSLYFFIEYPKPRFITDRANYNGNEICFTVVNPPYSIPIKIVDIKLEIFSYAEFTTRKTIIEPRFDLHVDISRDKFPQDKKEVMVELNTQKSISVFPSNRIIGLDGNSSASFRAKFRGDIYLSEVKFCIIVEYLGHEGKKGQITSDKVYIASKGFGMGSIEHIDVVDYKKLINEMKEMQKILIRSKEK